MDYNKQKQQVAEFINNDNYVKALELCCEIFKSNPGDIEIIRTIHFLFNRIQDANADFSPRNADEFLMRGSAKVHHGNVPEGMEDINKAIELNPKSDHAYHCRAFLHWQLSQFQKAIDDYFKAIEISPRGEYYGDLASMNRQLNDIPKCLYFNEMAITHSPNNPILWYHFGIDLAENGHPKEAIKKFDEAIRLWPEFEAAKINRQQIIDFLKP